MTPQLLEGATTEAIEGLATTAAVVAGAAAGSSAIVNTIISGSLAQLWGMINSMQILVHMGIFNVDFPANSKLVTNSIMMVATFDIPMVNVDDLVPEDIGLPEEESPIPVTRKSARLINAMDGIGYDSRFFGRVMGSVYIFIICTTIGLIFLLFSWAMRTKLRFAEKSYTKLKSAFVWNYIIRLIYECCLELTFVMILNSNPIERLFNASTFLESMDYIYTIIFNILLFAFPVFVILFYSINFKHWESEEFIETYGTVIEGFKLDISVLFYPFFFAIRRAALAVVAIYCFNDVWLQLSL